MTQIPDSAAPTPRRAASLHLSVILPSLLPSPAPSIRHFNEAIDQSLKRRKKQLRRQLGGGGRPAGTLLAAADASLVETGDRPKHFSVKFINFRLRSYPWDKFSSSVNETVRFSILTSPYFRLRQNHLPRSWILRSDGWRRPRARQLGQPGSRQVAGRPASQPAAQTDTFQ